MPHIRLAIVGDSRITVEGFEVTPVASHLFALLLVLTHHPDKRISRGELQDLLFPGSKTASLASHSLRQLLYRLRQTGLHFNETSVGLALTDAKIDGSLASLSRLTPQERARSGPGSLRVLPSYSPRLSPPFLEWLDCLRDNEQRKVLRLYLDDLARFRHLHSWANVIQLSKALLDIDPSNSDVVLACADALAMMGRRDEAINLLDDFVSDLPHDSGLLPVLRQLRSRIGKALPLRREASLHGRDSCLAYLEDEWLLAQSGGARQSSIVGHAGLGKTRVADAFAAHIALQGFPVLRYSCDAQSRQQPLSLFSDILPTLRQLRGSLGAAPEYKTALARLRPSSGKVELAMPGGSRDRVRSDIQEALIDLLEAVSAENSLLLIVDDAHFLDDASCALLHSLTTSSNSVALQVLVCSRPSHSPLQPLAPSKRSNVYTLAPLDAKDSRDLLIELRAGRSADEDYVLWCLSQSAGNPFYIRTLAANDFESVHLPFDIRSLASSNYSSLSADSRATLETCLLLGRLATIPRVVAITAISEPALLLALRDLESNDLIHYSGGLLCGPHALLHDALKSLIPGSVCALLHTRIALCLEMECIADGYACSLAWAASRSWLAAGDPRAATRLLRRCAVHVAGLGEPAAAASLLSEVDRSQLPDVLHADLLDDLIRYAQDGGCRRVAITALRDRVQLAHRLEEGQDKIQALELRTIEEDLLNGAPLASAVGPLNVLLNDAQTDAAVRYQAAVRLMIVADIDLDAELANRVYAVLISLRSARKGDFGYLRAELVYHTAFGDVERAHDLASGLLRSFPKPDASQASCRGRNFAAYAFHRLRDSALAVPLCEDTYEFMLKNGFLSEAIYSASLRTQIAITDGEFEVAREWFTKTEAAARGAPPQTISPNSGFHANAGMLAMMEGRYVDAERLFASPLRDYPTLAGARYRAISMAMAMRLKLVHPTTEQVSADVQALSELYEKGRALGGQDPIVETLWCSLVLNGKHQVASDLLFAYLTRYRRERSLPDWSLRHTTSADDAWGQIDSASPLTARSNQPQNICLA